MQNYFILLYVVTILHAIENLAMTVKYDQHVKVLVPEHKFQGITVIVFKHVKDKDTRNQPNSRNRRFHKSSG